MHNNIYLYICQMLTLFKSIRKKVSNKEINKIIEKKKNYKKRYIIKIKNDRNLSP